MFGILGIHSNHLFYFMFDRLECLPYTFRKLTNLKALWLSENQVMIQLTTDSYFSEHFSGTLRFEYDYKIKFEYDFSEPSLRALDSLLLHQSDLFLRTSHLLVSDTEEQEFSG